MSIIYRFLLLISLLGLQSCALWPYERDFDCPVSEGLKCKALHEVSELADQGYFASKHDKEAACCNTASSRCKGSKSKAGDKR